MKWKNKRVLSILLCMCLILGTGLTAFAADDSKPYLALGADLSESEKATVLEKLGVSASDLDNYDVITITNADEKNYLSDYVAESVIGGRSLSSVLITKKEEGSGIYVTTHNITYCTTGMYRNALITAGITDADVIVAGPFDISGTAALVGALKAYETMTGETVSEESIDAAVNELVTTGDIADTLGDSEKVEQLIALAKQYVVEGNLNSEEDIMNAIEQAASDLDITLTDAQRSQISSLMTKISALDIDKEALKTQAKELYNGLKDMGIDLDDAGVRAQIKDIFTSFIELLKSFFN
ncbi:DUF1002 domain-containing protein [Konateibacter massiliensis]|uniref:DUF1002 domain-containing protein n=1 Tax=Konateibacter massiliensis TaxID=2002841 RepID=UPI0015D4CC30|nr:DUF1002 domain-containing protein [Konateibacter massiliensis]